MENQDSDSIKNVESNLVDKTESDSQTINGVKKETYDGSSNNIVPLSSTQEITNNVDAVSNKVIENIHPTNKNVSESLKESPFDNHSKVLTNVDKDISTQKDSGQTSVNQDNVVSEQGENLTLPKHSLNTTNILSSKESFKNKNVTVFENSLSVGEADSLTSISVTVLDKNMSADSQPVSSIATTHTDGKQQEQGTLLSDSSQTIKSEMPSHVEQASHQTIVNNSGPVSHASSVSSQRIDVPLNGSLKESLPSNNADNSLSKVSSTPSQIVDSRQIPSTEPTQLERKHPSTSLAEHSPENIGAPPKLSSSVPPDSEAKSSLPLHHASEGNQTTADKVSVPSSSHSSSLPPSSVPHSLPMPPQAHDNKSNPHLIPIPSLPNSMMSPGMAMPAGMNMFPPHLMNPYFPGMMFDPRMAAAFQHPMFRGMPPLHPRYQQTPPQRAPRSRGPRGPRQSKAHQQHLPPEILRHHGRHPASDSAQIKIDPLLENPTAPHTSVGFTTTSHESSQASSSRSSTPRSHASMTSPVTTQADGMPHLEPGIPTNMVHPSSQQPPPAHSHGKLDIPPSLPGMMQMAHSYGKHDMPPHTLGGMSSTHESLPPPAHSFHPSMSASKSTVTTTSSPFTDTPTVTTVTTTHSDNVPTTNVSASLKQPSSSDGIPFLAMSTSGSIPTSSHSVSVTSTDMSVQQDSAKVVSTGEASLPLPAHSHPMTSQKMTTSGGIPMPAHVHTMVSTNSNQMVTQTAPISSATTSTNVTSASHHTIPSSKSGAPEPERVPSRGLPTSRLPPSVSENQGQMPSNATTPMSMPPNANTPMPMMSHATPMSMPHNVSTPMSMPHNVSTPMSMPHNVSTPMTMPNNVSTPMSMPHNVSTPMSMPHNAGTPMSMPGHFHQQGMVPMHPGMGLPFMQPGMRVRGPRMSSGKQRGPTPDMPAGMMPQFGRFPPGFNPFMSPQIARMAMSQEMMALAQKMSAGGPTISEGEQGAGPPMPKFENLTPNQIEFIRAMRMRPPFPQIPGMRPGMPMPPRNMPPPPRYPGPPMTSPTDAGAHRLPAMPHPSASLSGQTPMPPLASPTSSIRSIPESQSPHPSASPIAPSASPMSSFTGDKTPSPVPRSPANSDTTSVGSTPVKQEPTEHRFSSSCLGDDIDARTASQNALLKSLLANMAVGRPPGTPFSEDSEDGSALQLTPEQQKQLEMIERMPVIREVELSAEDWASKTPEEREKILELRKQAFEEKRKEFEEVRKKRKPPAEPRKRKKKPMDQIFPEMFSDGQMMMPQQQQPLQPPPKKRQRRPKQKKVDMEEDKDAKVESFLAQLRTLANVPLQEPKVISAIVNSPVHGSPSVLTGEGQLKGDFGNAYLDGVADFYGSTLLGGLPPLGSLVGLQPPKTMEPGRKLISDGQDIADHLKQKPGNEAAVPGSRGNTPFSMGSLTGMAPNPVVPSLPSQPRIEPRVQALRMSDSPDTVVSSSSPEHEYGDEEMDFPMLKPIDPPAEEDRRSSPALPLLQPIAIKAESLQIKEEKIERKEDYAETTRLMADDISDKKLAKFDPSVAAMAEKDITGKSNSFTSSLSHPLKDKDISVTLTLSAKAAEDIGGVLSSIAELLKIAVPPTYQVSRSPSPDSLKMNLKHKEDPINIHNLIKMKPKFCRNCDMVVLDKGFIRKKSEMPFMIKEDHFTFRESEDEDIAFCSQKCFERFVMVYRSIFKSGGLHSKLGQDPAFFSDKSPSAASLSPFPSTPPTIVSPRGSGFLTPNSSGERTPQLTPTTPTGAPMLMGGVESLTPTRQRQELEKIQGRKHKKDVPPKPPPKRWKNIRYKKWDPSFSQELQPRPETPKSEVEVLWKALGTIITPDPMPEDKRSCVFCQVIGDGPTDGPGRLLNMDVDKWVHLNCALWSSEVYETLNGDLMNVDVAFKRAQALECQSCKKSGATLGCFKVNCSKVFHIGCAQKAGCMFFQDKTILCPTHAPKIFPDNVLTNLSVYRKVYVNRDEDKQVASMIRGQEEGTYALRISSLILHSVGQLLPHQIATGKFHTRDFIYPVGFKSSRFYWSMRRLYKRCRYVCSISDNDGRPEFMIRVVEAGFEDIVMKDSSPRSVWFKVLEPLDKMRRNADLVKIFPSFMTGEELFGLTEPAIIRVIESLPGTDLLLDYAFKYGRCELIEMPLTINPSGCARTEPKLRTHFRKMHTLQSSHTSRSLPAMVTGVTGDINSPYMKQFVHSKSQQYRRLKTEWKINVFLGRSRIQGLGLFAARDLEKHTMVIEYIGYLIRNEVANRLEVVYDEQNRGVYMFRIDSDIVVDATMAGGPARYINHSCDPNCVAEVVPFDKESKIIIITNRRIPKGEELTYDYKFDFEDEQHKIPCCCGAKRCRKWMN
ncbi:histone-lysine N-methyltransferase MLL2 [Mytilus galloprovincialis]|uniref:Histone-lysine N-methyltransferase MLL2 n=1 Tax=Mytilus galloprovincialis TaxID=29158 RepID=A0A8B6FM01_MYTGA|nr:histone-lysine N-methyltransferase MLL2 [Mytilus galloprovincialis]